MSAIPAKYLKIMGTYPNINVHGVTVIVNTFDSATLGNNLISDFRFHIVSNKVEVVGIDFISKRIISQKACSTKFDAGLLVLCASNRCLIFHLDRIPKDYIVSVLNIVTDPNICCIGLVASASAKQYCCPSHIVEAGALAARVLKKPGLIESTLADLAREIGVRYDGPSTRTRTEITVDWRIPTVLSEEMVKTAISDAVAYYQFGCKLLQLTTINANSHVKNEYSG